MKKLFAMFVVAGMVAFVACGPSAEEKAKKQAEADSIAQAQAADSIAQIERAKFVEDSTLQAAALAAHEDSIAKGLIKIKK